MSNEIKDLLSELQTVCHLCIQRRLASLSESKRISRLVRERSVLLFAHYRAVVDAADELVYSPEDTSSLGDIKATLLDEALDFTGAESDLLAFMSTLSNRGDSELLLGDLTTNPLNKRMIDALFLLKDKIRIARQRLNDAGEEYDEQAYILARNRCSFNQSIYIGQLHRDLVSCTNEEMATLEQIHYPAIELSDGSSFPTAISDTATFLEGLILAVLTEA